MVETSFEEFMVTQRVNDQKFNEAIEVNREQVENFVIKSAIEVYLQARKRLDKVLTTDRKNDSSVEYERAMCKSTMETVFFNLQRTERFKTIKYIGYDEGRIMTKDGIFSKAAFTDASETNTLSFEQMQQIADNSEVKPLQI